jgi:ElaB/YqjD/DUF883 family membrane-anchored ribosome-binding protein
MMATENSSIGEAVREATGTHDGDAGTFAGRFGDGAAAAKQAVGTAIGFVQEQPWLAVAGAFVIGYVTAQLVKRMD